MSIRGTVSLAIAVVGLAAIQGCAQQFPAGPAWGAESNGPLSRRRRCPVWFAWKKSMGQADTLKFV